MTAEARQLDDMRQAAYRLGMGFAQAAEAEGDLELKLRLFDAFHRSFASVRLSIALAMRWAREARSPAPVEREAEREAERDEAPEPPDPIERPERLRYDERDRDREAERASLPLLLRTLAHVADDAQALLPRAAELPTLRDLLDRMGAKAASRPAAAGPGRPPAPEAGGLAVLTRPGPASGRARLMLGAAAPVPMLPKARRATGPP